MKKVPVFIGGIALLYGLGACSAAAPELVEGMWEITTEVHMPGVAMKIPPMMYRQCLTMKDFVPRQGPAGQEICTYSSAKTKGNTVAWSAECKSPGGITKSEYEITFMGTHFDGTMVMNMTGAVTMSGVNSMSGQRVGECQ